MEIVPVKSIIWSNIWSMPILTQLCNNCAKYWLKLICCVNIWKWVKTNFSHHAHATESCWTVDSEVCTDPSIDHFMAFAHLLGYDDVKIIRNVTFFLRILIRFAIACMCSFKLKKNAPIEWSRLIFLCNAYIAHYQNALSLHCKFLFGFERCSVASEAIQKIALRFVELEKWPSTCANACDHLNHTVYFFMRVFHSGREKWLFGATIGRFMASLGTAYVFFSWIL